MMPELAPLIVVIIDYYKAVYTENMDQSAVVIIGTILHWNIWI